MQSYTEPSSQNTQTFVHNELDRLLRLKDPLDLTNGDETILDQILFQQNKSTNQNQSKQLLQYLSSNEYDTDAIKYDLDIYNAQKKSNTTNEERRNFYVWALQIYNTRWTYESNTTKKYYHGLPKMFIFPNGIPKYNGPASTTIQANIEDIYKKQGSITHISKYLMQKIENKTEETIIHLPSYMKKVFALQKDNEFKIDNSEHDVIKINNYNFHDTNREILYTVATKYNQRGYKWKILDELFTAKDIRNKFGIAQDRLPFPVNEYAEFATQLNHKEHIIGCVNDTSYIKNLINKTKWENRDKIPIHCKKNNKRRMTYSLRKPEFKQILKENASKFKADNLIPMIMKHQHNDSYHVEFVQILRIQDITCDIGLSFKYDENTKKLKPVGIHLDGEFIKCQHQLACPNHDCHCLDNFRSNIDYLTIGDPDHMENKVKQQQTWLDKLKVFVESVKFWGNKMLLNPANMVIKNVQELINKAQNVLKNNGKKSNQNDYILNIMSLLGANETANIHTSKQLQESPLYIQHLQQINNFYFEQTLNPNPEPIKAHPMHQTHQQISKQKLRIIV